MNEDTRSAYGGDAHGAAAIVSALPRFFHVRLAWPALFALTVVLAAVDGGCDAGNAYGIGAVTFACYVIGFIDCRSAVMRRAVRVVTGRT